LCPNYYRSVHAGVDGHSHNEPLVATMLRIEPEGAG
jgi:hypothetical protein